MPWESQCQALRLGWSVQYVPESLHWLLGDAASSGEKRPLQYRSENMDSKRGRNMPFALPIPTDLSTLYFYFMFWTGIYPKAPRAF